VGRIKLTLILREAIWTLLKRKGFIFEGDLLLVTGQTPGK